MNPTVMPYLLKEATLHKCLRIWYNTSMAEDTPEQTKITVVRYVDRVGVVKDAIIEKLNPEPGDNNEPISMGVILHLARNTGMKYVVTEYGQEDAQFQTMPVKRIALMSDGSLEFFTKSNSHYRVTGDILGRDCAHRETDVLQPKSAEDDLEPQREGLLKQIRRLFGKK